MSWKTLADFDRYLEWRTETEMTIRLEAIATRTPVWHYWEEHIRM